LSVVCAIAAPEIVTAAASTSTTKPNRFIAFPPRSFL
jgi:hypothetical protein